MWEDALLFLSGRKNILVPVLEKITTTFSMLWHPDMAKMRSRDSKTTIFESKVAIPSGIDDAYEIRIFMPLFIMNSGRPYVRSYQEFIYRMLSNKNSLRSYYGQTYRFLNYAFYCLKVSKILEISPDHLKSFIKYRLGTRPNVGEGSLMRSLKHPKDYS